MPRGSERRRQLTHERWSRRQQEARTHKELTVVLVDMARAFVPEDDLLWEDLTRVLHARLGRVSL